MSEHISDSFMAVETSSRLADRPTTSIIWTELSGPPAAVDWTRVQRDDAYELLKATVERRERGERVVAAVDGVEDIGDDDVFIPLVSVLLLAGVEGIETSNDRGAQRLVDFHRSFAGVEPEHLE